MVSLQSAEPDAGRRTKVVFVNHTDVVRPEVDMLTRALPAEEFEITVLLPESARETLTRYAGIEYRFYRAWIVPNIRYTVPHPSFRSLLAAELRDADVLHIIGYIYLPCLIAAATANRRDVRSVLTVDAFPGVSWTYGNRFVDFVANGYTHTLGRATLSLVDHVVGIGEYLRTDLDRFTLGDADISIIPNGVDTDQYQPRTQRGGPAAGSDTTETVTKLLFVGRLDTVKGIPYLLRAFAALPEDEPYHLTIVGDGSRRQEYEELSSALEISQDVSFEGYQSDVRPYYEACDIFVLPSLSEGLPTVLIEAQACGVPVVSTDVGGARELVRGGRLVPKENPVALRTAIEELADENLAQLGATARQHVLANFTLEQMAEQYAELYSGAAATPRIP